LHDVDEDWVSIAFQGGAWGEENQSGITIRFLYYTSTSSRDFVASRQKITGLTHLSAMPVYFKKFV
jgi:hypothetical protein